MARTASLGRLTWRVGKVVESLPVSARARTLALSIPDWPGHWPGQHVDVRLTADDGYQAVRSYSIASAPERDHVEITVEEIEDGEVSPFLVRDVIPGDRFEVRGPIGGYFVWESTLGGPLLLVGGGSGIVPLMAMLRHRIATNSQIPVRLLYSARSEEDVLYDEELFASAKSGIEIIRTYTRTPPPDWKGYTRRVDAAMLEEVAWPLSAGAHTYVCGPTAFVELVAETLVEMGFGPQQIRTERFGPTGG